MKDNFNTTGFEFSWCPLVTNDQHKVAAETGIIQGRRNAKLSEKTAQGADAQIALGNPPCLHRVKGSYHVGKGQRQ